MPSERDVALMAFPRADAVAELGWTQPEQGPGAGPPEPGCRPSWRVTARLRLAADDEATRVKEDAATGG